MDKISRRRFMECTGTAAAAFFADARNASPYPLDGILGLQGNDIRHHLAQDYPGTLRQLAAWGYKAVDLVASQSPGKSAKEIRQLFDAAGMVCHNCHYSFAALHEQYGETIADSHVLGLKSLVCQSASPMKTADSWKKLADDLNALGEKTKRDGILTGYHNHVVEFRDVEGQVPFELLAKDTDPRLVRFQIDVGHLAQSGKDPLTYLANYPDRFFSMHAKEEKAGKIGFALGEGELDFRKIFTPARADGIRDYDVETGAPVETVMEKLRLSIEYLKKLTI